MKGAHMGGTNAIDIASESERAYKLNAKIEETEAEEQAAEEEEPFDNVVPLPSRGDPEPDYVDEETLQSDCDDELPAGFRYASDGSIQRHTGALKKEKEWRWLCSPVEFLATTGNADDKSPGLLVRLRSDGGRWHQLAFPRSESSLQRLPQRFALKRRTGRCAVWRAGLRWQLVPAS
jgi:hypothetical protein